LSKIRRAVANLLAHSQLFFKYSVIVVRCVSIFLPEGADILVSLEIRKKNDPKGTMAKFQIDKRYIFVHAENQLPTYSSFLQHISTREGGNFSITRNL